MTKGPDKNIDLIKKVLDGSYLALEVKDMTFRENFSAHATEVTLIIAHPDGSENKIEGQGEGLVDALFSGLLERYAEEYESLRSIKLGNFHAGIRKESNKVESGVDAAAQVEIDVYNSEGETFHFFDESRSLVSSTVRTVVAAVEYFVNAERAFVTLYTARKDAMARRRDDLVTRYTQEIAEVVKSTSYAEVIESMKKDMTP